jgi:hypothetical protein
VDATPLELVPGLWRWTARHPEWHPGRFGASVASFALRAEPGHATLIDPILPPEPAAVWELVDELAAERLTIAITIPYHVRDAERIWRRHRDRGTDTCLLGHRAVAKRLTHATALVQLKPGEAVRGVQPFAIGRPRRFEMPLYLASHRAIAFGDAVVTTPSGELRLWATDRVDENRARWYRERFAPTLEPLVALAPDHVLVTHGEPVIGRGAAALEQAVASKPWYHHG